MGKPYWIGFGVTMYYRFNIRLVLDRELQHHGWAVFSRLGTCILDDFRLLQD